MKRIIILTFLSIFVFSCTNDDWKSELEDMQTELDEVKNELANQKKLIEALQKNTTISSIEQRKESYTINFSDGQSITLTNGKTPLIKIGENGNWFINGKDSGMPSKGEDGQNGHDGKEPNIAIGDNGHWNIDGKDTGIRAIGIDGDNAPYIINIIDEGDFFIFNFSDDTSIKVKKGSTGLEKGLFITLPDTIFAVEDDNLQIFKRSIVHAFNPYIYDVLYISPKGKSYPRYYQYKPTAKDYGTYPLMVKIRNNNLETICESNSIVKILPKPKSPSKSLKILCIGASATEGGQWVGELKRRLTASDGDGTPANPKGLGLSNIEFVGRKTGESVLVKLEATGGWRVSDYAGKGKKAYRFFIDKANELKIGDIYQYGTMILVIQEINVTGSSGTIRCLEAWDSKTAVLPTNGNLNRKQGSGDESINYSSYKVEGYNPFFNQDTNKLDFKNYADKYSGGSIDYLVWHCGVNDIFSGNYDSIKKTIDSYKFIIRSYHFDFPNGKIILSSVPIGSPLGGFGSNYGASINGNYYTFLTMAQLYAKALHNLSNEPEFSQFVHYAAVMEEFDAEYGYPTTYTEVNNRTEEIIRMGINAVHPTTKGSYMVSDGIYRAICNSLTQ